jgi:PAS domain S-box-containing protein
MHSPAAELPGEMFRLLVASVKDYAIFLLDPDGRVRSWNEGAERIKGYSSAEILGQHFSIFYPPAEIRRGRPDYELRVALEEGRYEEDGWRIRKDGNRFWANVVITALFDGGELVGFAKVTRDLTERRRGEDEWGRILELERTARADAENALQRLRAIQSVTEAALANLTLDALFPGLLGRISEILEVDTVAVFLVSEDGLSLVPRAARGFDEVVELGVHIPIGESFAGRIAGERRALVVNDVERSDLPIPILRQKGIRSLLGVPLLVEGRVIGVLNVGTLYARRFTEADSEFLQVVADQVALSIDHGRLFEAERTARREAQEAGYAVRVRDEFLSVAAHELKTPVTSVRGLSEWLLRLAERGEEPDRARQRRALAMINRQSQNLSRLVTQLLEVVRLDAGRLEIERHEEDLVPLVRRIVEQAQSLTDRHELVLTAPAGLRASVDAFRFEQVVTNLLDNAIKYSPDGGPIEVELLEPRAGSVQLAVRDHGIGVPRGQRAEIFERFHQAHADSHRSGLGLGLYLSRQIVEQHHGRLELESPASGGSRFVVNLPSAERVVADR